MADTRTQVRVEDWVRREWMPERYGQRFSRERVALTSGEYLFEELIALSSQVIHFPENPARFKVRGDRARAKLRRGARAALLGLSVRRRP